MEFSVCLPAVLRGIKAEEALPMVRDAGYSRYEIWSWRNWNIEELLRLQQEKDLTITALSTNAIPLNDPAQRDAYLEALEETAQVCKKLNCRNILTQVGMEQEGVSRELQHESIVQGLKACVPILAAYDLTLNFEPLNTRVDHRGYYLWSAEEAFRITDEVGDPHIKVMYDLYHQYVMEDLDLELLLANIHKIGHFHMAGYPGRHEPMVDSEVDYPKILRAIRESGYAGGVGLEYFPVRPAAEGLEELREQLRRILK